MANNYDVNNNTYTHVGVPFNYTRGNPLPIDNSSVWTTLSDAENYALSSPVAYVGQIITVNDGTSVSAYVIENTAGTLKMLAVGGDTSALDAKINAEIANRAAADTFISGKVDTVSTDLDTLEASFNTLTGTTMPAKYNELSSGLSVTVEAQETAETGFLRTYVVKQGGVQVGAKINIPKDFLVKKAEVKTCTEAGVPVCDPALEVGDKYIDFTLNTKEGTGEDSHLYVNLKGLMDIYTGATTTTVKVEVGSDNKISANVLTGSIGTDYLIDSAVTTAKINDSAVTTDKIADATVTNAKVAENAIAEAQLSAGAVTTGKIADSAVTSDKIADNAITTGKIADGAVETADIKDAAVTHAKLAANSVEATNILSASVTEAKIADGAVSTDKLASEAVTDDKIASSAVTENKIASNAVTTAKISDNSVTTAKIVDYAVTTDKIASGNITKDKLSSEVITWVEGVGTTAESNANTYTDGKVSALSTELKGDVTTALNTAKAYTDTLSTAMDGKIDAEATARNTAVTNLSTELKGDIATEVTNRNSAIEAKGSVLSAYADQAEVDAIATSKAYTDEQITGLSVSTIYETKADAAAKLNEAKGYTDTEVAAEATERVALSTELKGDISTEATARETADIALNTTITTLSGEVAAISGNHETRIVTVEDKVSKLSSAMHFKGMATDESLSTGWTGTPIPPYKTGETPADGDVVIRISDSKEFIWGNSQWNELGVDTGIYATKAALEAEESRAQASESILSGMVATEETRATGVETGIRTDLNTVSTDLDTLEDSFNTLTGTTLPLSVGNLETAIATEATVRSTADTALDNKITAILTSYLSAIKLNGVEFDYTRESALASLSVEVISCGGAE